MFLFIFISPNRMADEEATNSSASSSKVKAEQSQNSDADDGPVVKRQKLDETKKITNICYDCLEHIFDFLDVESLLSLAHTCKRLQIGAAYYFGDEFGDRLIILDNHDGVAPGLLVDSRFIVSTRLKLCLALLRCFGKKISYLFVKTNDHIDQLIQYIVQYCGDALADVTFHQCLPVMPIENCQQPFKNVEKISVANGILNGQLAGLAHYFPNLKFFNCDSIAFDANFVGLCFPQMKFLTIKIDREVAQDNVTAKGLKHLVSANPQLESVSFDLGKKMALSTLLDITSSNTSISDLVLVPDPDSIRNVLDIVNESATELTRLATEHPPLVNLYLPECRMTADDAIALIGQLTSLKSFLFHVRNHSEFESFNNQLDKKWNVRLKAVISDVHFVELNC